MSKLKYFSDNKSIEIEYNPIDALLEVGMNEMPENEIKEFLSKLNRSQIADLKKEVKSWINYKSVSMDELAIKNGAKLINPLLKKFSAMNKLSSLNTKIKNFNKE